MRVYTFTHMWLSAMAIGIQAGHAKDELTNKYVYGVGGSTPDESKSMLREWSVNHKTHISLNGGNSKMMKELWTFLVNESNRFPYAKFHEDEDSLEGVITSIAMVLPERIYEAASLIRQKKVELVDSYLYPIDANVPSLERRDLEELCNSYGQYTFFEEDLMQRLNTYRLAS